MKKKSKQTKKQRKALQNALIEDMRRGNHMVFKELLVILKPAIGRVIEKVKAQEYYIAQEFMEVE